MDVAGENENSTGGPLLPVPVPCAVHHLQLLLLDRLSDSVIIFLLGQGYIPPPQEPFIPAYPSEGILLPFFCCVS